MRAKRRLLVQLPTIMPVAALLCGRSNLLGANRRGERPSLPISALRMLPRGHLCLQVAWRNENAETFAPDDHALIHCSRGKFPRNMFRMFREIRAAAAPHSICGSPRAARLSTTFLFPTNAANCSPGVAPRITES
jgi:hypothetical protein